MKQARIVILNGVSSAGKSTLAKAIQAIAADPFLYVPGDMFVGMLPAAMMDHPEGVTVRAAADGGLSIDFGPAIVRLLRGMRRSVAALASQGNELIVDDVMLDVGDQADYRGVLDAFDVKFVGVHTPLEVLERRESERKDRLIGLARWQYGRVHRGISYDIEVDTAAAARANARAESSRHSGFSAR